ncbi:MAG: hypothetical protein SV422_04705 [Pseudomonadota bacterium]|nr:hypothetical protein [Pseudomonadota bacterium]
MPGIPEQNDILIDRYLNRQMSDAESDAFEQRLFEDEQLFVRVQLLDAFKTALAQQRATLDPPRRTFPLTFSAWVEQPFSRIAALLVLGLGLQFGYGLVATDDAREAVGIDTTFVLEATRGANAVTLNGAPPYLFQVDAGFEAADAEIALALRAADGTELLNVAALPVDAGGWARFLYDEPLSGHYSLELANAADGSALREFDLTIND